MSVATTKTTMLYCPKCRSTYEEGSQRFCSNDGGRLLPVAQRSDSLTPAGGVFTSILGKMPHHDADERVPQTPPIASPRSGKPEQPKTATPISKIYETQMRTEMPPMSLDEDSILELGFDEPLDGPLNRETPPRLAASASTEPATENKDDSRVAATERPFEFTELELPIDAPPDREPESPAAVASRSTAVAPVPSIDSEFAAPETRSGSPEPEMPKPAPKLVNPYEIPSGTAEIGDRAAQPAGRGALSWKAPRALVGQTIKGRYQVTELIGDDEDSLEYVADDRISGGKRVVVRVYLDDAAYAENVADERVVLAHLDHPNIAAVFDSGELQEGFPFTVAEYVDGQSLSASLRSAGEFNTKRTARIMRQASYALSAAHENGILHRNLKPENIMLTVSDAGIELVKLVNFEQSNSFWIESDLVYKSPEEIAGENPTFASEIWSLAVIAYEMLCARLPFNALSERELVAMQESGIALPASSVRTDVSELADRILEKALSFDPSERYSNARDFGDAFFNALAAVPRIVQAETVPTAAANEPAPVDETLADRQREFVVVPPIIGKTAGETAAAGDIRIGPSVDLGEPDADESPTAETEELSWQKRSPESLRTSNWVWGVLPVIGALLLLAALWGVWRFLALRPADVPAPEIASSDSQPLQTPETAPILPPTAEVDRPPVPRRLNAGEGLTRFVNTQQSLKGDLARNFLGFEIFYPAEMERSESETNFLDIATRTDAGVPVEQMIITRYKSRGAMTLDRPNFRKLAETSNATLKGLVGESFRVVGEGETAIQNGRWKGYEVKFEGKLPDGKTRLFGRRLWIPVQSPGVQNGFVITLLATSIAEGIDSAEDVGTKGLLATAVENFEPEQ